MPKFPVGAVVAAATIAVLALGLASLIILSPKDQQPVAEASTAPSTTPAAAPAPVATPETVPSSRTYDRIVVVVLENHSVGSVLGNAEAPYLNGLANVSSTATGYTGVAQVSLPNYLALTGGSTFGINSDCTSCFISEPSIADLIEAAGLDWKSYQESMPSPCFAGSAYPYAQKHDPFYYYTAIRHTPARCARIVPLSALAGNFASPSTAPNFSLVTPNMCNDGHDCSLATTDAWLAAFIPTVMNSPAFKGSRSLLVVTYDEGDNDDRVLTVFAGDGVRASYRSAHAYNHYSLLRTIEDALGLPTLGKNDRLATPMKEFFT